MKDFIELPDVVWDSRARDGTWCCLPYPDHPKGCPNFPKCPDEQPDFREHHFDYKWYAIIEEFDLATHAEKMKRKHPTWSERQCRNLFYWQNGVRQRLLQKALSHKEKGDILLQIPEASGVNVFVTLGYVNVILQRTKPNYIVKTMLLGKPKNASKQTVLCEA